MRVLRAVSWQPKRATMLWLAVALLIAAAYAWPIATRAYGEVLELNYQSRVRLIQQHRLWEVQPDFRGKPEAWTRMAAHLLTDGQLLRRVWVKYGTAAEAIELEYRRDLAIARAEIVLAWLVIWAGPLVAFYALSVLVRHRRNAPVAPVARAEPASISDPRYRPPPKA